MILDISTIITAMAFILYVLFAVFGFTQSKKERFYWSFQIYVVVIAVWSFGSFMMHLNSSILTPLAWNRIMLVGLLSVPFTLTHSVIDIMGFHNRRYNLFKSLSYLLLIPLMILNFRGTIVTDAGYTPEGLFFYELGRGAAAAYSISYVFLIVTLGIMMFESRKNSSVEIRKKLRLPLLGTVIMLIGILFNLFPALSIYPFDILSAGINAMLLFYTIYRYKLVYYSRVALRIMLVIVLSLSASAIYYLILTLISHVSPVYAPDDILPVAVLLGFATALIISPLRSLMAYFVDTVIIPRRHPYQAAIRELSRKLTTVIDLQQLGDEVVSSITTGLKAQWAVFLVEDIKSQDGRFVLVSNENCPSQLHTGDTVELDFTAFLHEELESSRSQDISPLIYSPNREEQFSVSPQLPPADIIIPLVYRKQISGYIIGSFPSSKDVISKFEIEALEILAAQSSLSLKNALSFEHIKAQGDELYLSKSKLEAIFNGIVLPVILSNVDYTILEVNNAATLFFGQTREALIGQKCYRAFFHRSRPCSFCKSLDCIHGGGMIELETEVHGSIYSFQFNNVKVPQNQKMVFVEIIRDVTEQKRLQEDLIRTEKMAGIGTMAAGIAHELNNPLAGISGTAEIILSELEEHSAIREYAEDILAYAMNAADVIKELSVYTRKGEPELREVDIIRVLEFSLRLATRGVDSQGVAVKRNYHAMPQIKAHESELQQLFLNLIVNAIQAMEGSGELTLICSEERGSVYITVEDTGCGIPADNLNQIFTPFFTTKPPGTGTGLGLSNCFNIVEKMYGRIRVRSTAGEGSAFSVILPVTEKGKTAIRFSLVREDESALNDIFYIQRKVLIGEKGYIEESIQRTFDTEALHILAFRGIHPVGTVSLLTSAKIWPLPVSRNFNVDDYVSRGTGAEIIRLAVLPEARNSTVSIGLIMLVYLLARSLGIETLLIDVFSDDEKTINLYHKFGFSEIGSYYSPAAVTVLLLKGKSIMEYDEKRIKSFLRPLYKKLIPMFDFSEELNAGIISEMEQIVRQKLR